MAPSTDNGVKPLKTASIVDLRESSTRDLLKQQHILDKSQFPYSGDAAKSLAEFSIGSHRRVELEKAATTTVQREAYGARLWEQRFVRMKDVRVPEGCRMTVEALRKELWKAVPPSNFRRFQELFSDPYNLVVPRFRIEGRSRIVFIGNPDFEHMSVAGCLVSPDRIPDDFCRNVLKIKFTAVELEDGRARFLRKAHIDVIERLKRLWDSAETISGPEARSFRVLRIHRPTDATNARYVNAGPFPVGYHGTLLVTRGDTSDRIVKSNPPLGPERVRPLRISHFNTVYDAHRGALHVACGYRGEGEDLASLRARVSMGLKRIDGEVRADAPQGVKDSVRAEVSETIRDGTAVLNGSIAEKKRKAADLLGRVEDCRDSRGRVNWGVTSSRMHTTGRLLSSRMGEMSAKGGHVQVDEAHLRNIIKAEYAILEAFRKTLAENADQVLTRQRRTGIPSSPPAIRSMDTATALSRLVPHRRSLEDVSCRPFSTFAGLLREGVRDLESALQRRNYRQIEESVVKMHIVGKLFKANDHVQSMQSLLVDPQLVPMERLQREVAEMRKGLALRVVKGINLSSYEEHFHALEVQAADLAKKLSAAPKASASDAAREQYFLELKELLDSVRPERTAWEFVPQTWRRRSGQSTPQLPGRP